MEKNKLPERQPSIREAQKKIRRETRKLQANAWKIIKMIEKAHRDAGKSKLRFDCPLDPTNPSSVAIYKFLKELDRFEKASRRSKVWAG